MTTYTNTSGADFTLPDGRTVAHGGVVDLSDDVAAIPGVSQFIAAGKLRKAAVEMPVEPAPATVEMPVEPAPATVEMPVEPAPATVEMPVEPAPKATGKK